VDGIPGRNPGNDRQGTIPPLVGSITTVPSTFAFEFHTNVPGADLLRRDVESQLRELAAGHTDLTGASVALEPPLQAETSYLYEARVVAYMRPANLVGVEQHEMATAALRGAVQAVERQVREERTRRKQRSRRPKRH
jgi:ribosome-associated translation inhibitor RaiA